MTVIQGFILGIIQGLAEFLPISSSGHLVLFQKLFGLNEGVVTFDIAVHLATLIPVFIIFWKDIVRMIRRPLDKLPLLVIFGTIPTVIIAILFNDFFENLFESGAGLALGFIFTGLVLIYAESIRSRNKGLNEMTFADAGTIGIVQGVAILPAVSRSGSTIAAALMRGVSRELALKFSFLLSIPIILGAVVKETYEVVKVGDFVGMGLITIPIIVGMIAASISGYIAIRFMLRIFSKASFKAFAWYVFVLGAFILADQIFFGKFFPRLF